MTQTFTRRERGGVSQLPRDLAQSPEALPRFWIGESGRFSCAATTHFPSFRLAFCLAPADIRTCLAGFTSMGATMPFAFHKNHHLFRLAKFKYRNRRRDADDLEYSISLGRRCLDRAVTCNNSDLPDASGARQHISDPYQTPNPFERLVTFGRSIIAPALGRSGVADSPAIFYEFRLYGRHGARARQSIATESF